MVERIDNAALTGLELSAVRSKLSLSNLCLRIWRPATNSVFEFDVEVAVQHPLSHAQGSRNPQHQLQQRHHFDTGLM
jgi:hypothetical protein